MKLLIVIFVLFSSPLRGQNAREIVNRYLDTVSNGSIDNWNKIKSIYTESEVYYSQNDFEQNVNLVKPDKPNFHKSYAVLPYNKKIEIYEDSSFRKRLSEFYYFKDKIIILFDNIPPMEKQLPEQDEFFSAHLPVQISKLVSKSKSVELLGVKEFPLERVLCYEIKVVTKGRAYFLYINTETFLLEYWNGREDGDISILARFYNYKRIDDFLIPMSDFYIRHGVIYSSNNTRKYLINSDIDPEIFKYKR